MSTSDMDSEHSRSMISPGEQFQKKKMKSGQMETNFEISLLN